MYNHETEQFEGEQDSVLSVEKSFFIFSVAFIGMALFYLLTLVSLPFVLLYQAIKK